MIVNKQMVMFNSSKNFSRPGVYITDVSAKLHAIQGTDTSVTAFIGLTRRGPVNKPIKILKFAEYEGIFGGLVKQYLMGYSIQHFFTNGGTTCYVIRVRSSDGKQFVSDKTIIGDAAGNKSGGTGIHALDSIDYFNILCIPPFNKKNTVSNTVYRNALKYCERRRAILIIDPPCRWTKNHAGKLPNVDELEKIVGNLRHANAALYFPQIRAPDPLDGDNIRTFVPCGAVAGIIARTDDTRGVWKAAAGIESNIRGVTELDLTLTDKENGLLNERGVNCIRAIPPAGIVIWGARTLIRKECKNDAAHFWKYLPVRRTALFIEESLYRGTKWTVFERNDEPLWAKIRFSVSAFMSHLFRSGAFQGRKQSDAYFVKCDSETTTPEDVRNGIVNIHVGFAPLRPAEFVVIKIQQMTEPYSNHIRKYRHSHKNRK